MIPLMRAKLPSGEAVFLTLTIGGVTTNVHNPKHTDVYSDAFPDGITVAMTIDEFCDLWMGHLVGDIDKDEDE